MRIGLVIAAIVATAAQGCASGAQQMAAGPVYSVLIPRSMQSVRDCLADIGPRILVAPYGDGFRLTLRDIYTGFMLLTPQGGGVRAQAFGSAAGRRDGFPALIRRCEPPA
jgi:hypothetical protein